MQEILGTLVLIPIEQLLNQLLVQDPHLSRKLLRFSNRVIEINSHRPAGVVLVRFLDGKVRLGALSASTLGLQADAIISGSATDLFSQLLIRDGKSLANRDMAISGDALLVQDLFHLLRDADIDWRDYLGPFLGDVMTQEVSQFGHRAGEWGKQARANMHRSVDEYLREELALVPAGVEIERFNDLLDQLKLALDRAEARADSLHSRLDKSLKNQQLSE